MTHDEMERRIRKLKSELDKRYDRVLDSLGRDVVLLVVCTLLLFGIFHALDTIKGHHALHHPDCTECYSNDE